MHKVLFVDDEPIFLDFMQRVIDWKKEDCEIVGTAEDGRTAMMLIQRLMPDIAFIDINMPRMTGLEVCEWVRARNNPMHLVIVTAHDEFAFAYQAIKLGIDDFLLKPFSREELEKTLHKVLSGKASKDPADPPGEEESLNPTRDEIIASMIDGYLETHYQDPTLSLQAVAEELNFTSGHLRRIYKNARQETFMHKLEEIRFREAKKLLRMGIYQGQEISAMTGFSDPFYFSKRFKQITGMTPTEYRILYPAGKDREA